MSPPAKSKILASKRAIEHVKNFEGLRLRAYRDLNGAWCIGYGHSNGVTPGMNIGISEANYLLSTELKRISYRINRLVSADLEQHHIDALVALAYNIGLGAFRRSTLLKKLNNGDFRAAAAEFPRWVHVKGKVLPGLKRRRLAEMSLFLGRT